MATKKALITGITGQDGSYLAELLLSKGYNVTGIVRNKTNLGNIAHLSKEIEVYESTLEDFRKLKFLILKSKPTQIYNLGGVTNLSAFAENISYATKVTEGAPRLIFETALDLQKKGHNIKIFQASSCLIFGSPMTPYAAAKSRVDEYAAGLRGKEGLQVSCGILYNHESPRRPLDYVTRKITAAAACIHNKVKKIPRDRFGKPILTEDFKLPLGDINTRRDWGDARDFVRAFLLMLEKEVADDYIIATGKTHSVKDILDIAFGILNLDWHDYVTQNNEFIRSKNPAVLCGDATKARSILGWTPQIKFEELIREMVENDVKIFSQ